MITVKELQKISIARFNKCDCKNHRKARTLLARINAKLKKRAKVGYNSLSVDLRREHYEVVAILKNHLQYLGFTAKIHSPGSDVYLNISWK